ncbi:XRE family transcriptional regulator [Paenibacillus sp. 1011MAR3C5]|uniref:helix-turn-helix domain-containing protein n=1 Tax=Paenibacillus sp. 1011MAR3C5 TaxID=1675787 RepID=UPI000E6CB1A0|nr:helix-turn-helix transcriptional regulator [Paenibacillus sp. 1011MAR3C5]RJE83914.1 XRE family transcriptional regulator [Paenibacillus sp. 1011MAR3C5]
MEILRKFIGNRIRTIRKRKGMTQEALAEKADLMYQYIGGVERGTRNISLDSLEKILIALDVEYNELFPFNNLKDNPVDETEMNKEYVLTVHTEFLRSKSLEEVKAIHRISEEILKSFGRQ